MQMAEIRRLTLPAYARLVAALWLMARPLIMVSVVLVYLLGNLIARTVDGMDGNGLVWGLLALLPTMVSIHYANEYADVETDRLTARTPFSGGSQVIPNSLVSRQVALLAAWFALITGLVIALLGVLLGKLSGAALLILIAGALGGWMYSLPPLALGWRGWGEVTNAILGGILLALYGYVVQTGVPDWRTIAVCLPFAFLVFNNLLATTWPDRHADRIAGKRTLATRLSPPQLRRLYGFVALLSFALIVALSDRSGLPDEVFLGSLLAFPVVAWGYQRYTRQESPLPSVMAMVALLILQMVAWYWAGNS